MNRIRDLIIFALCILLALAPAVSANSGPTSWTGTTASGIHVAFEECPIQVEHENLTFDIPEFPLEYYENPGDFLGYNASVTAEYSLYNPTEADVTVQLLFPFGTVPQYAPEGMSPEERYGVFADGEPVQTQLLHSLAWGTVFDMDTDSALLRDDYTDHAFYFPDMPVTQYTYLPKDVTWPDRQWIEAALRLEKNTGKTKYIIEPYNFFRSEEDYALAGCSIGKDEPVTVTCIGADPGSDLPWLIYADGHLKDALSGTMECVGSVQMTLREYALSFRPESSDVSEIDWYNSYVDLLDRNETGFGFMGDTFHIRLDWNLMRWYEYSLTIPAGQRVKNTVTAPMYPDINTGWDPAIYSYGYLFSPAEKWVIFGSLDVTINTPYHMTQSSLKGFEKTDSGYEAHLTELPWEEFEFVLSSVPHPDKPGAHATRTLWFFIALTALLVTGLIRRKRK